jgi:hypothetical protein
MAVSYRKHDPFWGDGRGARRTHRRRKAESVIALVLAIGACGLTAAMWLRQLAPVAEQLLG